jgi:uncharacterized membrane protein YphA (DoxX/SURF4 family)
MSPHSFFLDDKGSEKVHVYFGLAAPLLTRICLSFVFLQSGALKVAKHEMTIAFFQHLGFASSSALLAIFIPLVELSCGLMLLIGLFTWQASVILGLEMAVAICVANRDAFASFGLMFRLYDFLYILLFL